MYMISLYIHAPVSDHNHSSQIFSY
uniref:Uncharacterized protein n=1 Tax=Rhizophora mucronata TaxID=61149 RepID=A0A2P2IWQ4_RHIMU